MVQRLRLHASTAGDRGSIPGQETKILQATWFSHKKKKKKEKRKERKKEKEKKKCIMFTRLWDP